MTDTSRSSHDSIGLADLKRALEPDHSGQDVSDEDIVAYHHGELPEERADEVRAFLAADPEWESALEDARHSETVAAESGVEDEATIDAAWQDFQSRLGEIDDPAEPTPVLPFNAGRSGPSAADGQAKHPPSSFGGGWWEKAALVLFGLAIGALGFFLAPADSDIRLVELEPLRPEAGPLLGGDDPTSFGSLGHDLLVLKLWPPAVLERDGELPATAQFRLRRGNAVERRGETELQDGAYVASLPIGELESGEYRIEVDLGSAGDPQTLIYKLNWKTELP